MTLSVKKEYLRAIRDRYFNSSKKQKSLILDELCATAGFSRKYAIKILAIKHKEGKKLSGRSRSYSKESIFHLRKLWHIMDHMCSKKMVAAFPIWIEFYQAPNFTLSVKQELLSMSHSTVDRYLKPYRARFRRYKNTGTRFGGKPHIKQIIPLKPFNQKVYRPGFVETDTVAHCGGSLSGKFIWSLTFTDVYSGWTDNYAIWDKGSGEVLSAIDYIDRRLPYEMVSCNVDNGSEFLNYSLIEYMRDVKKVDLTRSRPFKKNDNCHVEQKNGTHVRETFGYQRLEHEYLIKYMNEIYKDYHNVLYNFFVPQLKLAEKRREGAKYKKKFEKPKTPYQRLMESKHLSMKEKEELKRKYELLNPITLKREMARKISMFEKLVERSKIESFKYETA